MALGGMLHPEWLRLKSTSAQTFFAPSSFPVTNTPPTLLYRGYWPLSGSASEVLPSILSITILQIADLSPNQMGLARIKMSASLISSRIMGQSSPSPSSELFPKATLKSAMRITLHFTPACSYNSTAFWTNTPVLESPGDGLRVQLRNIALIDIMIWF